MASPMARPTPSTTEAATPLRAAGRITLKLVSSSVAPSAREPSVYSLGTALRAVSDTLIMEGRIITASTRMAASRLSPAFRSKRSLMAGTSTIMPTRPYTTEGMPASRSTAGRTAAASLGGATRARNTAVRMPTGTPSTIAPQVPHTEVRIKGRMP